MTEDEKKAAKPDAEAATEPEATPEADATVEDADAGAAAATEAAAPEADDAAEDPPEDDVVPELDLEDGAIVFSEGDIGSVAYSVLDGTVEIFKIGPDGKEIILTELDIGELFGHMALIDEAPRSASARCKGPTRLRVLDRKLLMARMGESPELAMHIMHGLVDFVRSANDKVVVTSFDQALYESDSDRSQSSEGGWLDRLLPWRNRTNQVIATFQPDALEIENRPVPAIARLGAYMICAFLGAIVLWGSIAEVDTAISGRGVLAPIVSNVSVQATEQGIIRQLHVAEGQTVRAGEPLVTLDNTEVVAQIEAAEAQRVTVEAKLARMQAEFRTRMSAGNPERFSPDNEENRIQLEIFVSRKAEFLSQVQAYNRRLDSMRFRNSAIDQDILLADEQLELLRQLEDARQTLFRRQVGSKVQYLTTVFERLTTQREVGNLQNSIEQLDADIKATDAELNAFVSGWFSDLAEQIVDAREEQKKLEEQLVTLNKRRDNLDITSDIDAIVLNTHGFATGSVLRAAEEIVTMVPIDTDMLVRLDIGAQDISKLNIGSDVSLKLDALPFQKHGEIRGRVEFISEDTFNETVFGEPGPVYRARIALTDNKLTDIPSDFRLIPGMAVTGDVRTGQRRVITYFIYPILRWLGTSLRET